MYARWKKLARNSGDPARLTKCENIDVEAKARIAALFTGITLPTASEILAHQLSFTDGPAVPIEVFQAGEIRIHGRNRCRQMVNRPLPFVTSYNPNTDTEWPY